MAEISLKKRKRALILSGGGARGAYQVGVWKYLQQMNWKPDLICGASVGSVNAVAIGSGMDLGEMVQLWKTIERGHVFRLSIWQQIVHFLTRRGYTPFMDTDPLRRLLEERMDIPNLRKSPQEIIIAAVNIIRSQLKFFNHKVIDIEHVMASAAIPILFPWQYIDGEPYWDGGIMMNTPILPALERGVKEVVVVLLSPVGGVRLAPPATRRQAIERVFEMSLIGSYESFMSHLAYEQKVKQHQGVIKNLVRRTLTLGDARIATVAPTQMLGFQSILNFGARQADQLIQEGYNDAKNQLAPFFGLDDAPYTNA